MGKIEQNNTTTLLILGAGLSTRPLVVYLVSEAKFKVILASRTKAKIEKMTENLDKNLVENVELDIETEDGLNLLNVLADRVSGIVSMLPYLHHPLVARIALRHEKHFFTTSYLSPALREMEQEIKEKNLFFLNECGVDPGTDHMTIMKIIHRAQKEGGKITELRSLCGGLPSPSSNNNPLGYKFSWAPRGVLLAGKNDATYFKGGEKTIIKSSDLYVNPPADKVNEDLPTFDWFPGRDSTPYAKIYGIEGIDTLIRGTYRYPGWCESLSSFAKLNYLSDTVFDSKVNSFSDVIRTLINSTSELKELKADTAKFLSVALDSHVISVMEWLELFSDDKIPDNINNSLDLLCNQMLQKMQYEAGETDMIAMKNKITIEFPDRFEHITSTLVDHGIPNGDSSMSRTVSYPIAIAIRLFFEGKIKLTGLHIPIIPELYNPILKELSALGISFKETVETEPVHLWLRDEVKPNEKRTPLTPENTKTMLQAGYRISVEKSQTRCFSDEEYEKAGCTMVSAGSWVSAPKTTFIVGLKELPESDEPLIHRHIFFAHCFKEQAGARKILDRFVNGSGSLYDIEFLKVDGRRVAAFGVEAGIVGAAVGVANWNHQQKNEDLIGKLHAWPSKDEMFQELEQNLNGAANKPKALIFGAKGRCGKGAFSVFEKLGIETLLYDIEETQGKGPFPEVLDVDIVVNCIYLQGKTLPFITDSLIDSKPDRKLVTIVDVSCDPSSPYNPLPIYSEGTTIEQPCIRLRDTPKKLDIISIDHLPALLPREASENFANDLLPYMIELKNINTNKVWCDGFDLFVSKSAN